MEIHVHLYSQSEPIVIKEVENAYQKGDFYCVMVHGGNCVYKFPVQHIFRITEWIKL